MTERDITGDIGPLHSNAVIPMLSFDTPATIIWQAVYDGLRAAGRTDAEAVAWMQSKDARWAVEAIETQLRELGLTLGRSAGIGD